VVIVTEHFVVPVPLGDGGSTVCSYSPSLVSFDTDFASASASAIVSALSVFAGGTSVFLGDRNLL